MAMEKGEWMIVAVAGIGIRRAYVLLEPPTAEEFREERSARQRAFDEHHRPYDPDRMPQSWGSPGVARTAPERPAPPDVGRDFVSRFGGGE